MDWIGLERLRVWDWLWLMDSWVYGLLCAVRVTERVAIDRLCACENGRKELVIDNVRERR